MQFGTAQMNDRTIEPPAHAYAVYLKRIAVRLLCAVILLIGCAALIWWTIQWRDNFHEVDPKRFYRSAQMDGQTLRQIINQHGIKTVLNLRGTNHGQPWYDGEVTVTEATGVRLLDVPLSAYRELTLEQMQALVLLMKTSPKPLLVHCASGADRTGLAAALYKLSQGAPLSVADDELSAKYGHFPMLVSDSAAMGRSLTKYAAFLQAKTPSALSP